MHAQAATSELDLLLIAEGFAVIVNELRTVVGVDAAAHWVFHLDLGTSLS